MSGFDPLTAAFGLGEKLVDHFFPSAEKKAAAMLELAKLQQNGELAAMAAEANLAQGQLEINKVEAASTNWFVAGARPFVIWICASGLGLQVVVAPFVEWVSMLVGHPTKMPPLDTGTLSTLLIGLLGLGGMRTAEKLSGVQGNH